MPAPPGTGGKKTVSTKYALIWIDRVKAPDWLANRAKPVYRLLISSCTSPVRYPLPSFTLKVAWRDHTFS